MAHLKFFTNYLSWMQNSFFLITWIFDKENYKVSKSFRYRYAVLRNKSTKNQHSDSCTKNILLVCCLKSCCNSFVLWNIKLLIQLSQTSNIAISAILNPAAGLIVIVCEFVCLIVLRQIKLTNCLQRVKCLFLSRWCASPIKRCEPTVDACQLSKLFQNS